MRLVNSLNGELTGDIVQAHCVIYKIHAYETETNVYGEAGEKGKSYWPGIDMTAWMDRLLRSFCLFLFICL